MAVLLHDDFCNLRRQVGLYLDGLGHHECLRPACMQLAQYWIEGLLKGDISPEVTRGRLVPGTYLARDTKLNRDVVLKILTMPPATTARIRGSLYWRPDRIQRILQKAKAALALKHRNVAAIYEIGENSGHWFVAMEYVRGEPLDPRIGGYPLSATDIAGIGIEVADALIDAHGRGIVHGDIKPSNIMMIPGGQVKLLNFGWGREITEERCDWPEVTEGFVVDMLRYSSPEQFFVSLPADCRSDLFSLGIVLYEIATCQYLFWAQNPQELLKVMMCEQPQDVAQLNANVPAELGRIIHKCLERDLERRYQSARDLAMDLKNINDNMATQPVQTR